MIINLIEAVKSLLDSDFTSKSIKNFRDRALDELVEGESISEMTRASRSEPIALIDSDLKLVPEVADLMWVITTIYSAMYAQAFSLSVNAVIEDLKVVKHLEKLNPNRSVISGIRNVAFESLDSSSLALPSYNIASMENNTTSTNETGKSSKRHSVYVKQGSATVNILNSPGGSNSKPGEDVGSDTREVQKLMSNLSTGTMFEVKAGRGDNSVTIPITVRLLANEMSSDIFKSILSAAVVNQTAKERYHEWRSGGISFWADVVFCKNILRERRRLMIKDKSGIYSEILNRRDKQAWLGRLTKTPSVSQISNIMVISKETVQQFELDSGKKLSDKKVQKLIFDNTSTMILAVVDRSLNTVTLYYHDVSVPTTVTFRELQRGKKSDTDPMEVLRAYQMGNGIRI